MPRLLLVDDNPSIHRIAESLLSGTAVELVCVDSGAEALKRVSAGEHFDVALVDTVMAGMDGWDLVDRFRAMPATARMPIALMAGVLDAVDPMRLERAPIQGFLKKPIELRDLAERVRALMATPVPDPEAPEEAFQTRPGLRLEQLLEPAPPPPPAPHTLDPESDLLVLDVEDLLDEPAQAEAEAEPELVLEELNLEGLPSAAAAPAPAFEAEPELELEELNLEGLRGLPAAPAPYTTAPVHALEPAFEEELDLGEIGAAEEPPLIHSVDLDALPPFPAPEPTAFAMLPPPAPVAAPEPEPVHAFHAPEPEPAEALALDADALPTLDELPEMPAAPVMETPAAAAPAASVAAPSGAPLEAYALIQAILSDPVLVEALSKAVVSQLGDQALKEVAWELMPELAAKLRR